MVTVFITKPTMNAKFSLSYFVWFVSFVVQKTLPFSAIATNSYLFITVNIIGPLNTIRFAWEHISNSIGGVQQAVRVVEGRDYPGSEKSICSCVVDVQVDCPARITIS
jgi:hypothetical protein